MQTCRKLDKNAPPAREALLAATTIHLAPGDLLCAASGDSTLATLAPKALKKEARLHGSLLVSPPTLSAITTATAAARGLQASGTGIALAFASAGTTEAGWQAALEWAQRSEVPLILAVSDASNGKSSRVSTKSPKLDWPTISSFAARLKLPILTVDGEDAVAVYRVMQESVIRARFGGGPAVIWAVMSGTKVPTSQQPIARLETYMSARKISFRG
jgi:TPP-dependent pyruvate/acetoin dehydrogenase alpha subunit